MKPVVYEGIKARYNEREGIVYARVESMDVLAAVEKCPICGTLHGTHFIHQSDMAGRYREQAIDALHKHMHEAHIVRYRAEIIDMKRQGWNILATSPWTHNEARAISDGQELIKKFEGELVRLHIREVFQA